MEFFNRQWSERMLSVLRIIVGLLFLEHGLAKLLDFPHGPTHVAYVLFTINPGVQGLIELVGGLLLTIGLFTRPVGFILSGDMAVAYFMAHAPAGFLSYAEWRGVGNRLLLPLLVFRSGRGGRLERRPAALRDCPSRTTNGAKYCITEIFDE